MRQKLREHGIIGEEERGFIALKNRQFTEAEKQQIENYQPGDVIIYHQHGKGIKAGSRLSVTDAAEGNIHTTDSTGETYTVATADARKFTVYEPCRIAIAEGDKIRITSNGKANDGKHLFNGTNYQVRGFEADGSIALSNGSTLSPDFGHFALGYVSTSHAAQGKTADKVIVSQSSASFRAASMEQFYVSVSRGKQAVSIYTDDKQELQQAVSHSSERTSATELMATRQAQAQEMQRQSFFHRWQEKSTDAYTHLKSKYYDGLSPTARTEQTEASR